MLVNSAAFNAFIVFLLPGYLHTVGHVDEVVLLWVQLQRVAQLSKNSQLYTWAVLKILIGRGWIDQVKTEALE